MKTIRKYQVGGVSLANPATSTAALTAAPALALTGLAKLAQYTYEHPETISYSIGKRKAEDEKRLAAQASLYNDAVENAAIRDENNARVANYYRNLLLNGPVVETTNGGTKTILGYDPKTGLITANFINTNGSRMEGTFPSVDYMSASGRNLALEGDSKIWIPNKGWYKGVLKGIEGNQLQYGTGEQLISAEPITINRDVNFGPITLKRENIVTLPKTLPIANLYDNIADIYVSNTEAIPVPEDSDEGQQIPDEATVEESTNVTEENVVPGPSNPDPNPNDKDDKEDKRSWIQKLYDVNLENPSKYQWLFQLNKPLNPFTIIPKTIGYGAPVLGIGELVGRPLVNSGRIERTPLEVILDWYFPKKKNNTDESQPIDELGAVMVMPASVDTDINIDQW